MIAIRSTRILIATLAVIILVSVVVYRNFLSDVDSASKLPMREIDPSDFLCPRCNVIFLNIELLRADHTGLIAGTKFTSSMDDFFRNGMIFHDVTAPAGETFLSNTAILTGVHPYRLDIAGMAIDKYSNLKENEQQRIRRALTKSETWAEILQKNGYHTININQGRRAGRGVFLDRGFEDYSQWTSQILFEDMADLLIEKLSQPYDKPIFMLFRPTFLHNHQYRNPDIPQSLRWTNIQRSDYSYEAPDKTEKNGVLMKRNRRSSDEEQRIMERQIYLAQLEYGNQVLQPVFQFLQNNYANNSIIVLYANHGSGLGDNGTFNHGTSYQASVHVPLFIRHPNFDQAIPVRDAVSLFDLVPTISKMIGVEEADWSLLETYDKTIMRGKREDSRPIVGKNSWDEYIRKDHWKLIVKFGRIKSLFNLDTDPFEKNDLMFDEPEKATELELLLTEFKSNIYSQFGPPE